MPEGGDAGLKAVAPSKPASPQNGSSRVGTSAPMRPASALTTLAIGMIVVAALYIAREIFVPLAVAILLSFALGPLVQLLRRLRFGRIPSIIAAVVLAFLVIFGVGALIGEQLAQLAGNLPGYQVNIVEKIHTLRSSAINKGLVGRASIMLQDLGAEITKAPPPAAGKPPVAAAAAPHEPQPQKPLPVEMHQPDPTTFQIVESVIGPLLQPLATAGIVIVFVIFFLVQREDLRDRFIRLAGARDLRRTTAALDDAGSRLSGYLLAQTAINSCFGVLVGVGLWIIGVPDPLLWGILSLLLRFVPYIGAVIAVLFPAALAVAVDPGWTMLFWTIALFAVVEPVTSQIVEPILFGRSAGLSPVAVVLAAAFWTWLWGPVGLLLSTPLTLCLVVLGRHVEHLKFLEVAFGNRPALTPEEGFYQRILAGDPDEAAYQAEEFLKDKTLAAYYDEVAIKGLALAQLDVNRGLLDHPRRVQVKSAIDDVIDDLSDHDDPAAAEEGKIASSDAMPPGWGDNAILCVAGRGSLDEAAAAMLAQLLTRQGLGAQVVSSPAVAAGAIFHLDVSGVQIVCLSYLEPGGFTNARYLVRRLRRRLPRVQILVGFWTMAAADVGPLDALRQTGADAIVTSLAEAMQKITLAAKRDAVPVAAMSEAGIAPQPAVG
jgi:predicted PurR-regulated permease PerM